MTGGEFGTKFEFGAKRAGLAWRLRASKDGGERGIRTLDTVSRIHAFQACAFDHSATSPYQLTQEMKSRVGEDKRTHLLE